MHPHSAQPRRPARSGFTIIELLIVVTIIAVLMALTLRVVGAFVTAARESATQTTIRKIQGLLNQRAEALQRQLQRDSFVTNSPEYFRVKNSDVPLSTASAALQKICAKKLIIRKYFPQHAGEIRSDDLDLRSAVFRQKFPTVSNAEVLCELLTQSDVLGDAPIGTDAFSTSEVQDTDNNGLPEFLDGWGRPLRFYRWPTRLFRSSGDPSVAISAADLANIKTLFSTLPSFSGNLANDLARDPDDPLQFTARLMPSPLENYVVAGYSTPCFHTPRTYHVMLVVSAGPDGVFGMYPPEDTTNFGHLGAVQSVEALADDITYLNVRAGGK